MTSFRELHVPGQPLLMPNAWDAGSARLLAGQGFRALATTSSGFAGTLGRRDGAVSRGEALAHGAALAAAVDVPVSADLENGFADRPDAVADIVTEAAGLGLAGCSIEDYSGTELYSTAAAVERVAAAAEAAATARAAGRDFVLTARAENHIRGNPDLSDTIARLQAYAEAGADVLFAPGLRSLGDIRTALAEIDRPFSVLLLAGVPSVPELADAGVSRISVGGGFYKVAMAALLHAGVELLRTGTSDWLITGAQADEALAASFDPD